MPKHLFCKEKRTSLKKKVNLIHNFSSIQLSESAKSVLNKGLNFCPAQKNINYTQLLADLFRMERKMAWKHYFKDSEVDEETSVKSKFSFPDKKRKTSMPNEYPKEINEFISSVRSELIGSESKKKHSNLTKEEWDALDELNTLQKEGKIVIQPADKNGGICVLDRDDYINEANRQLNDTLKNENNEDLNYYKKTNEKSVKDQFKAIEKAIEEGNDEGYFPK